MISRGGKEALGGTKFRFVATLAFMMLANALQIAAPCGAHVYEKLRIQELDRYLDFWNLMVSVRLIAERSQLMFPAGLRCKVTPFPHVEPAHLFVALGFLVTTRRSPSSVVRRQPGQPVC